jgi:hypothetical protein
MTDKTIKKVKKSEEPHGGKSTEGVNNDKKDIEKPADKILIFHENDGILFPSFHTSKTIEVLIPTDQVKDPEKIIEEINKKGTFHAEKITYSGYSTEYLRIIKEHYDLEKDAGYVKKLKKIASKITEGEVSQFFKEYRVVVYNGGLAIKVKDGKILETYMINKDETLTDLEGNHGGTLSNLLRP